MKDTPADKAAAQNDADRDLEAEGNERRWGFDEARRRREEARKKAGTEPAAAEGPPPASGVSLTPGPGPKPPAPSGARDPGVTPPP